VDSFLGHPGFFWIVLLALVSFCVFVALIYQELEYALLLRRDWISESPFHPTEFPTEAVLQEYHREPVAYSLALVDLDLQVFEATLLRNDSPVSFFISNLSFQRRKRDGFTTKIYGNGDGNGDGNAITPLSVPVFLPFFKPGICEIINGHEGWPETIPFIKSGADDDSRQQGSL